MIAPPDTEAGKVRKPVLRSALSLLVFALSLFVPAGTLRWPGVWVFLGNHGGCQSRGHDLARAPRPRAVQGALAAALSARPEALGQGADGRLPAAVVRLVRGPRPALTSGPYAYVRHPIYASVILLLLGAPLLLGSWWGLCVAVVLILMLGFRAVMEERMFTAEFDGYRDYAARVRYRLVPLLW
jgi:hypothetical protein